MPDIVRVAINNKAVQAVVLVLDVCSLLYPFFLPSKFKVFLYILLFVQIYLFAQCDANKKITTNDKLSMWIWIFSLAVMVFPYQRLNIPSPYEYGFSPLLLILQVIAIQGMVCFLRFQDEDPNGTEDQDR